MVAQGRVLRTVHVLSMLTADAAFTYAGAKLSNEAETDASKRRLHRTVALSAMGLTVVSGYRHETLESMSLPESFVQFFQPGTTTTVTPRAPRPSCNSCTSAVWCSPVDSQSPWTAARCAPFAASLPTAHSICASWPRYTGGVITGLVVVVISGLAMLTADIETFFGSWIFWTKMGLVAVLLLNGLMMMRAETALAKDAAPASPAWVSLRRGAIVSLALWFIITALGVAIVNLS
jgi:hypothetical protein